jgi:hypothetical protein
MGARRSADGGRQLLIGNLAAVFSGSRERGAVEMLVPLCRDALLAFKQVSLQPVVALDPATWCGPPRMGRGRLSDGRRCGREFLLRTLSGLATDVLADGAAADPMFAQELQRPLLEVRAAVCVCPCCG